MNIKKTISLVTLICFLTSFVARDVVAAVTAAPRVPASVNRVLEELVIPSSFGMISDARFFGSRKTVITIQDLHCHPEVQRNIARILSLLQQRYSFSTVYVEGASGDISTSWLSGIRNVRFKTGIVESLVDRGRITGEEYYAALSRSTAQLRGIENESAHRENIVRLGKILSRQERYDAALAEMRHNLSAAQKRNFTSPNSRFNSLLEQYRNGKISSEKYYARLLKYAEGIRNNPSRFGTVYTILPGNYTTINTYLALQKTGRRLHYGRVSFQLQRFLNDQKRRLPYSVYARLVKKTGQFSQQEELYLYLARLAKEENFDVGAAYPDLKEFFDYQEKIQSLNPIRLLEEERNLIESIRLGLSENVAELEVSFLVDFLGCYEDYLKDRLQDEEYDYFIQRFDRFNALWRKYIPGRTIEELAADYPLLNDYYRVNRERNNYFFANTLGREPSGAGSVPGVSAESFTRDTVPKVLASLDGGSEAVVVVTGGFHTGGFSRLLREQGISYLAITPHVTTEAAQADAVYRTLALEQARMMSSALRLIPLSAQYTPEQVTAMVEALEPLFNGVFSRRSLDSVMKELVDAWNTNDGKTLADARAQAGYLAYEYLGQRGEKHEFAIRFEGTGRELHFVLDGTKKWKAKRDRIILDVKALPAPATETVRETAAEESAEQQAVPSADREEPAAGRQEKTIEKNSAAVKEGAEAEEFHGIKAGIAAAGRALREEARKNGEVYQLDEIVGVMHLLDEKKNAQGERAENPRYNDFLAGRITLRQFLAGFGKIPKKEQLLNYATDQSPYPLQFLVEGIVNGQDAVLRLLAILGLLEKSGPVGQFGEGAYQIFKELVGAGDAVVVLETSTGKDASRFVIWLEEGKLVTAFVRLPYTGLPRGTRIVVDKKIDDPAKGKRYVAESLDANAQSVIKDENGDVVNHPENYTYGNLPGNIRLRAPPEQERPATRFGIWEDGILFLDVGDGMDLDKVFSRFLTPKLTDKKITPDFIAADSLYKYDSEDDRGSVIRPYIKGETPVHTIAGYRVDPGEGRFRLAKEMVIAFPRGTRISKDRSVLNLGENNKVGVEALEKLIDILTDPSQDIPDREVQLNTLMQLLRLMRKRMNGSSTGIEQELMKYAADKVREGGLLRKYDIVLPNRAAWRGVAPFEKSVVYLDEALYHLPDVLSPDVFTDVTDEPLFSEVKRPSLKIYTVPFDVQGAESPIIVEAVGQEHYIFVNRKVYEEAPEDPEKLLLKRIGIELEHLPRAPEKVKPRSDIAAREAVVRAAAISLAREETHIESDLVAAVRNRDTAIINDIVGEKKLNLRTTRRNWFGKTVSLSVELNDAARLSDADIRRTLYRYGYRTALLTYYKSYARQNELEPRLEEELVTAFMHQGHSEESARELVDRDVDWRLTKASFDRKNFAEYTTSRYGESIEHYNIGRLFGAAKEAFRKGRMRGGAGGLIKGGVAAFFMFGVELVHTLYLRYPGSVLGYFYFGQGKDVYLSHAKLLRVVTDDIANQVDPVVAARIPVFNLTVGFINGETGLVTGERARRAYNIMRRGTDTAASIAEHSFLLAVARYAKTRAKFYFWSAIVASQLLFFLYGSHLFLIPLFMYYNYKLYGWVTTIGKTLPGEQGRSLKLKFLVVGTLVWAAPLTLAYLGVPLFAFNLTNYIAMLSTHLSGMLLGIGGLNIALSLINSRVIIRTPITAVLLQFGRFKRLHRERLVDAQVFKGELALETANGVQGFRPAGAETVVPWKFDGDTLLAYLDNLVLHRNDAELPAKAKESLEREIETNMPLLREVLVHDDQPLVRQRIVRASAIQKAQMLKLLTVLQPEAPPVDMQRVAELKRTVRELNALAEVELLRDRNFWKTVLGVTLGLWLVNIEVEFFTTQLVAIDRALSWLTGAEIHVFKELGMLLEGPYGYCAINPLPNSGLLLYTYDSPLGNFVIHYGGLQNLFDSLVHEALFRYPDLHYLVDPAAVASNAAAAGVTYEQAIIDMNAREMGLMNTFDNEIRKMSRENVTPIKMGSVEGDTSNRLSDELYVNMTGDSEAPIHASNASAGKIIGSEKVHLDAWGSGDGSKVRLFERVDGEIQDVQVTSDNGDIIPSHRTGDRGEFVVFDHKGPVTVNWEIAVHERPLAFDVANNLSQAESDAMPQVWKDRLDAVQNKSVDEKIRVIDGITAEYFVYDYDNYQKVLHDGKHVDLDAAKGFVDRHQRVPVNCVSSSDLYVLLARYAGLRSFVAGFIGQDGNGLYSNIIGHAMPVVLDQNGTGNLHEATGKLPVASVGPTWSRTAILDGRVITALAGGVMVIVSAVTLAASIVTARQINLFKRRQPQEAQEFRNYVGALKHPGKDLLFVRYRTDDGAGTADTLSSSFNRLIGKKDEKKKDDSDLYFQATLPWGRVVLGKTFTHQVWKRTLHDVSKYSEGGLYIERTGGAWKLYPFRYGNGSSLGGNGKSRIQYADHKVIGDKLYILGTVKKYGGLSRRMVVVQVDEQGEKILSPEKEKWKFLPQRVSFAENSGNSGYVIHDRNAESIKNVGMCVDGLAAIGYYLSKVNGIWGSVAYIVLTAVILANLSVLYAFFLKHSEISRIDDGRLKMLVNENKSYEISVIGNEPVPYLTKFKLFLRKNELSITPEYSDGRKWSKKIVVPVSDHYELLRQQGNWYVMTIKKDRGVSLYDENGQPVFETSNMQVWDAAVDNKFGRTELGTDLVPALQKLAALSPAALENIVKFAEIGPGYYAVFADGTAALLAGSRAIDGEDRYLGTTGSGMSLVANAAGDELRLLDAEGRTMAAPFKLRWAAARSRGKVTWRHDPDLSLPPVAVKDDYYQLLVMEQENGDRYLTLLQAKNGALTAYDDFSARTGLPVSDEIAKITGLDAALFREWDQPVRSFYDAGGLTLLKNLIDDSPFPNGTSPFAFADISDEERRENELRMERDAEYLGKLDDAARLLTGLLPGRVKHWSLAYAFMPDLLPVPLSYTGGDRLSDFVKRFIKANGSANQDRLRELLRPVAGIYRLGIPEEAEADAIVARYLAAMEADGNGEGEFAKSLRNSLLEPLGKTHYTGIDLLSPDRKESWKDIPSLQQFYLTYLTSGMEQMLKEEDESSAPRTILKTLTGRPGDSLAKLVRVAKQVDDLQRQGFDEVIRRFNAETEKIQSRDISGAVSGQEGVLPVWVRELVQNARDAVRGAAGRQHIRIRSYLNKDGRGRFRWTVSVHDDGGMLFDIILMKLLVPDATTKSYTAELEELVRSFRGRSDNELVEEMLHTKFLEEASKDPAVRRRVAALIAAGRDTAPEKIAFEYSTQKQLLKKVFAGAKGQGFFTVFNDADEVFIRSGIDGKVYELTLRPIREGTEVTDIEFVSMKEFEDKAGAFKGTEVRHIKEIGNETGKAQMDNMLLYYYTAKMIGAISDVEVTWNGKSVLDEMEQVTPAFRRSKTGFNRLNVDQLFIQDPDAYGQMHVPHEIAGLLLALGANYDYERETSVVTTRSAVQDPDRFKYKGAVNTLQAAAQLWRQGKIELPGLPPYEEYMRRFPWNDMPAGKGLLSDAAAINRGDTTEALWKRYDQLYAENARRWVELMLSIEPSPGEKSIREMKEERYFGKVPDALKKSLTERQKRKAGVDEEWMTPTEDRTELLRQGLYAYLRAYALLVADGTLEAGKGWKDTGAGNDIAKRVQQGEKKALDEVNGSNWQTAALALELPEIGMSAGALLQRTPEERQKLLQTAGIDRNIGNNAAVHAIDEVFKGFVAALGREFGEESGVPFLRFDLRSTGLRKAFVSFIEGNSVVPLVDEFMKSLPAGERLRYSRSLYDRWLKESFDVARLREGLLKESTSDELTSALDQLDRQTASRRRVVLTVSAEPPDAGEGRAYAIKDNARAINLALGFLTMATLGLLHFPVNIAHMLLFEIAGLAGMWSLVLFGDHLRTVRLADEKRPKVPVEDFEVDLTGSSAGPYEQLGDGWEKVVDGETVARIADAIRSRGGTRIRFVNVLPAGSYAVTKGKTVYFPSWIAAKSDDGEFSLLRGKLVDMLIVHEGLRLQFGERWAGPAQTAAIYLLKPFVNMRGSAQNVRETLGRMLAPRRFAEELSAAREYATLRYRNVVKELTHEEGQFRKSIIHIAGDKARLSRVLAIAAYGNDNGLHNIVVSQTSPFRGAKELFNIEIPEERSSLTVYAEIEDGVLVLHVKTPHLSSATFEILKMLSGLEKYGGDAEALRTLRALYEENGIFGDLEFDKLSFAPGMIVNYRGVWEASDREKDAAYRLLLEDTVFVAVKEKDGRDGKTADRPYDFIIEPGTSSAELFDIYRRESILRDLSDSVMRGRMVIAEKNVSDADIAAGAGAYAKRLAEQSRNAAGILLKSEEGKYSDALRKVVAALHGKKQKVYGSFRAASDGDIRAIAGQMNSGEKGRAKRKEMLQRFDGAVIDMSDAKPADMERLLRLLRRSVRSSALLVVIPPATLPADAAALQYARDNGIYLNMNLTTVELSAEAVTGFESAYIGSALNLKEVGRDRDRINRFFGEVLPGLPFKVLIVNADEVVAQLPSGLLDNALLKTALFRILAIREKTPGEIVQDQKKLAFALKEKQLQDELLLLNRYLEAVARMRSGNEGGFVPGEWRPDGIVAYQMKKLEGNPEAQQTFLEGTAARLLLMKEKNEGRLERLKTGFADPAMEAMLGEILLERALLVRTGKWEEREERAVNISMDDNLPFAVAVDNYVRDHYRTIQTLKKVKEPGKDLQQAIAELIAVLKLYSDPKEMKMEEMKTINGVSYKALLSAA